MVKLVMKKIGCISIVISEVIFCVVDGSVGVCC